MSFIPTAAITDKTAFVEGTTALIPVGGEWNDASATLVSGQTAAFRITEKRAAHVNLRNETGVELGTAAAPLKVDGSGVTQPISGAVTVSNFPASTPVSGSVSVSNFPATQPISGAVSVSALPGLAAGSNVIGKVLLYDGAGNSIASTSGALNVAIVSGGGGSGSVSVTNFPATQPVSAAALPLPAGASTAAKQPALGTAGTASADVITVQGIASGVAQPVSGSVSVSNFPATQPVSGALSVSNFPATQPVSGSVVVTGTVASSTLAAVIQANRATVEIGGPTSAARIVYGPSAALPLYTSATAIIPAVSGKWIKVYAITCAIAPNVWMSASGGPYGTTNQTTLAFEEGLTGSKFIWDANTTLPGAAPTVASVPQFGITAQTPPGFSYVTSVSGVAIGLGTAPNITLGSTSGPIVIYVYYSYLSAAPF